MAFEHAFSARKPDASKPPGQGEAGATRRSFFRLVAFLALVFSAGVLFTAHRRATMAELKLRHLAEQIDARTALSGSVPEHLSDLGWRLYTVFPDGVAQDPWGRPIQYRAPGTQGRRYDLTSLGGDGVPSADDITWPPASIGRSR